MASQLPAPPQTSFRRQADTICQVVQSYRTGTASVETVPRPVVRPGHLLVRTACSLISPGTERMGIELGRKSLLGKARSRPDLVKKALAKARTDGLVATVRATQARLDEWAPLGYSCAGTVEAVGDGVEGFAPGARVACAGVGCACHADAVLVPERLAAAVPEGVGLEAAAFVALGATAMQGLRQGEVAVGARVAIIGLGLLGQLACRLVGAAGAFAYGIDVDPVRVAKAQAAGAADAMVRDHPELEQWVARVTDGAGFDAVLIAAATRSNDPVELAGEIARDRATVVALGAVGMDVPRRAYYHKELTFRLSRSYGPGRYDPAYEGKGIDYPIGYVRWTENRNMAAFLRLLADGKLAVDDLVTHRFAVDQATDAYAIVSGDRPEPHLGILLTYPGAAAAGEARPAQSARVRCSAAAGSAPGVGLIGAGRFARSVLLPALRRAGGCELRGVASARGLSARQAEKQFGFAYATCEAGHILADDATDAVVVATPHHLHARMVCRALEAGKHVFVEKPLCLTAAELDSVARAASAHPDQLVMVGFNRRFSPFTAWVREQVAGAGPLVMHYRVLAGPPPSDHWAADPAIGGGRLLGEACHFVDWMAAACGSLPSGVAARPIPDGGDGAVVVVDFEDGSVGTLTYSAAAPPGRPKEHIHVLAGDRAVEIHNWRSARAWGQGGTRRCRSWAQSKGHREEVAAFVAAVRGGLPAPIPFAELCAVAAAVLGIPEALHTGQRLPVACACPEDSGSGPQS